MKIVKPPPYSQDSKDQSQKAGAAAGLVEFLQMYLKSVWHLTQRPGLTAQSGDKLLSFVHGWRLMLPHAHGLINYIDIKAKCRHLKKSWPVKGLCGSCLSKFIDWRFSQSCWYFRLSLMNCCPSNIFSGSTSPLPSVKVEYRQSVWLWPDWEPTKLLDHPKQKPRRGGAPQTDKHLSQSTFTGQFFRWLPFALVFI